MSLFADRAPNDPLRYFEMICGIPHPSGFEQELGKKILNLAIEKGYAARMDESGNVRIDRPAAPGMEKAPHIILQGHLDMVPKAAPGKIFDFTQTPVKLIIENGYIRADDTTLGADNGAGCAAAFSILFDPALKAGKLSGLFTTGEETGLIGANALKPDMLEGDWLFNLDSGNYHRFCIGCAGGAKLSFTIPISRTTPPEGNTFRVKLGGLEGGHSGEMIDKKTGNALILLSRFLKEISCASIIFFEGGSADNAIPADAEAVIVTTLSAEDLKSKANEFTIRSSGEFNAPESYRIEITETACNTKSMTPEFSKLFLRLVSSVKNEVFDFDESLGIVKTSSNFAIVNTSDDQLLINTSQRSLTDSEREKATGDIRRHFAPLGGTANVAGVYSGWPARPESEPVKIAAKVHREQYGTDLELYAIHAGLETGAFAKKKESLQIVSFGPPEEDIHTERERLNIAKYEDFCKFLRLVVKKAAELKSGE